MSNPTAVKAWPDDDDDDDENAIPRVNVANKVEEMERVEMSDVWFATTTEGDAHRVTLAAMLKQWIVDESRSRVPDLFRSPNEFLELVLRMLRATRGDGCRIALLNVVSEAYCAPGLAFKADLSAGVIAQIMTEALNGSQTNADMEALATLVVKIVSRDDPVCDFGLYTELRDALAAAISNVALYTASPARFVLVRAVLHLTQGFTQYLLRAGTATENPSIVLRDAVTAEAFDCSALRVALTSITSTDINAMSLDHVDLMMQSFAAFATLSAAAATLLQGTPMPNALRRPLWPQVSASMLNLWDRINGGEDGTEYVERATVSYAAFLFANFKNTQVSRAELQELFTLDVCIAVVNMCYPIVDRMHKTAGTINFKPQAYRLKSLMEVIAGIAEIIPTQIAPQHAFLRQRLAMGVYSPALEYAETLPPDVLLSVLQCLVKFSDAMGGGGNPLATRDVSPRPHDDAEQKMIGPSVVAGLQIALRRFHDDALATIQTLQALNRCAGGTRDLSHKVFFHTKDLRDELLCTLERHKGDKDIVQTLLVCINRIVDSTAPSVEVFSHRAVIQAFVNFAKTATDDAARLLPSMVCALAAVKLKEHFCTTDIRDLLVKVTVNATTTEARFVGLSAITSLVHDFTDEQRQMYLSQDLRQVIINAAQSGSTLEEQLVVCAFVSAMCSDTKTKTSEFYCNDAVRNAIVTVAARATDEAVKCRAASCVNHMVLIANRLGVRFITPRLRDVILNYFEDLRADDFKAAVINATTAMVTHDEASRTRFAHPTVRDKLIGMIEGSSTSDERVRLCCVNVVCLMASQSPERRNFFDTVPMRSALLLLAEAAQNERTIEYVCFAFVTLLDNKESVKWTAARAARLMETMGTKVSSPTASASYLRALECLIDDADHIGLYATNGMAAVLSRFQDPLMYALTVTVALRLSVSRAGNDFMRQPKYVTLFSAIAKGAKTPDDLQRAFPFMLVAVCSQESRFFQDPSAPVPKLDLHVFIGTAYAVQQNTSWEKFRMSFWTFLKQLFSALEPRVLNDFVAMKRSWRAADDVMWTPPPNASAKLKELIASVRDIVVGLPPVSPLVTAPPPAAAAFVATSGSAGDPSPDSPAGEARSGNRFPPMALGMTPLPESITKSWPPLAVKDAEFLRSMIAIETKALLNSGPSSRLSLDPFRHPTPLSTAASIPPPHRDSEALAASQAEQLAKAREVLGLAAGVPMRVERIQALRPFFTRPLSAHYNE